VIAAGNFRFSSAEDGTAGGGRISYFVGAEAGEDEGGFDDAGIGGAGEDAIPEPERIDEDGGHQNEEDGADDGIETVVEDLCLDGSQLGGG
jgi:hypothetical protein